MASKKYRVILEPAEEGGYVVRCVDLPGANSQGETIKEALENIKDAIKGILEAREKALKVQAKEARVVEVTIP